MLKVERADQKRIRELEALNNDIENRSSGVAGFKDCRPLAAQKLNPLSKNEKEIKKSGTINTQTTSRSTISNGSK